MLAFLYLPVSILIAMEYLFPNFYNFLKPASGKFAKFQSIPSCQMSSRSRTPECRLMESLKLMDPLQVEK